MILVKNFFFLAWKCIISGLFCRSEFLQLLENQLSYFQNYYFFKILWSFHGPYNQRKCRWKKQKWFLNFLLIKFLNLLLYLFLRIWLYSQKSWTLVIGNVTSENILPQWATRRNHAISCPEQLKQDLRNEKSCVGLCHFYPGKRLKGA